MIPVIFGLAGPVLTSEERRFFASANPAGYILFGRNISDPYQVRRLTGDLRQLSGRDNLPILIDQEGGRVARLRPPHWPMFPAASAFDRLYQVAPCSALAAARSNAVCIGLTLASLGISVNCAPVLDLRHPGCHEIVGDRSFGSSPGQVAALGRAVLEGLGSCGIVGVIKHLPGHGRALADSHVHLPVVDASPQDLAQEVAPFAALAGQARMAMTAHILFTQWDTAKPATLSPGIIRDIIRRDMGFDGLLMSDDIEMEALEGSVEQRASRALAAGCDVVLHCSGGMESMLSVAEHVGPMASLGRHRLERAMMPRINDAPSGLFEQSSRHRDELLSLVA